MQININTYLPHDLRELTPLPLCNAETNSIYMRLWALLVSSLSCRRYGGVGKSGGWGKDYDMNHDDY